MYDLGLAEANMIWMWRFKHRSTHHSLTKLGQGSNNSVDTIIGVSEWWAVSAAPRELCGNSEHNWVLHQVLRCQVTYLLLASIIDLNLWIQLTHLVHTDLSWITNVV